MGDGRTVTAELAGTLLQEEMEKIRRAIGDAQYAAGRYALASEIFVDLITSRDFVPFLTIPAYEYLD